MTQFAKIAYIMSRFPHLPETFILREINQLAKLGWEISLYPIVNQEQAVLHPMAEKWLSKAIKAPLLSLEILRSNGRVFLQRPFKYGRVWLQAIAENLSSPKFLSRTLLTIPKAIYFSEKMQAEGITHIHAHYASHPALMAWVIHHLTGIPYTVTVHAHDIFVKFNMLKTKLQDARRIVAISEFNIHHLEKIVGKQIAENCTLIHCGIDYAGYQNSFEQTPPSNNIFQLINIGSLQPYKGQSYLIEACAQLRELDIPFHCRIIGEGENREQLTQQIDQLNLTNHVTLLGAKTQDEVRQLLSTADCYIQPSIITPEGKMEGIPVVLMEAMATCLPVIATNISGIPELVQPGKTGYLVPPADAAALAKKIIHLFNNRNEALKLAENGKHEVQRSFSLVENVKQLSTLFETITVKNSSKQIIST